MFEGIRNFSEMFSKMGELKAQTEKMQAFMDRLRVIGDAGAGMVQVVMNGKGLALDVKINRALIDGEEIKMLEDLILSAINEAQRKVKESMEDEYRKTLGMNPEELMNIIKKGGNPSV